jgi:hypothetical protein
MYLNIIRGISPVIMSPTEMKMQPKIHFQNTQLFWKRIVGCIFESVGLIITREIPCIYGINQDLENISIVDAIMN